MKPSLMQRAAAEFFGTGFLVTAIVGSGIMADRLSGGNPALALLANSVATGAALVAIILALAPVSGAHLNPVVTLTEAMRGALPGSEAPTYVVGQIIGGIAGALAANLMFGLPVVSLSHHARGGYAQCVSEFAATFGLIAIIRCSARFRAAAVPLAVGAYITAAYWFTPSTSFANPAVTISRCLTDTFTGIRPGDVGPFVVAQLFGGLAAALGLRWLFRGWAEPAASQAFEPQRQPIEQPAPTPK